MGKFTIILFCILRLIMKKTSFILLMIFLFSSLVFAGNFDSHFYNEKDSSKINSKRLLLVSSVVPAATIGVSVYLNNVWWRGYKVPFHITDSLDWVYARKLDKAGHFWSCMVVSDVFGNLMHWSGMSKNKSMWFGAGYAVLLSTIIEVKDAYSPWWGFSMSDLSADILGSFYPLIQYKFPVMRNFNIKWSYDFIKTSYYSTTLYHENPSFMDDYERHNYWLSVNVCDLFFKSEKIKKFDFINLGIGVSAEQLDGKGGGKNELFFAFDLDLTKLINSKKKGVNMINHFVNYYHLPAPAVRVLPSKVLYGLTF